MEIKEVTMTRSLSAEINKNWHRFEYGLTVGLDEEDTLPEVKNYLHNEIDETLGKQLEVVLKSEGLLDD